MKINNEIKLGLFVIAVISILVGLTIKTGKIQFADEGYHIKVHFKDIDGVNLNSPVMYNGFEVGVVKDITIKHVGDSIKMELTLWMKRSARLKGGAKAYIKNLGFMGEKYVGLTSGNQAEAYLAENAIIQGEEPPDLVVLYSGAKEVLAKVDGIATNLNERLEVNKYTIDEMLIAARETMKNISSLAEKTSNKLEVNDESIDAIVENLEMISENFKELSYDLKLHPWKILHRSKEKR